MATIKFSNGQVVNFNGTPTQADVEEIAAKMGIHSPTPAQAQPAQAATPTPPPQSAFGAIKETVVNAGRNLLGIDKGILKGAASTIKDTNVLGTMHQMAGDKADWTGQTFADQKAAMQPSTGAETLGFYGEKAAELGVPVVGGAKALAAKATPDILAVVAPKLTARETAEALTARGGTKSGLLRNITVNPDPAVQRIADAVTKFVPDFNPKAPLVENINTVKNAVGTLAENLKRAVVDSGQDRIYSFKELNSTLKGLERPTLLVGDSEKVYNNVISKAMEIARSNGGRVSDLFQARKEFDHFVQQQLPNLYNSDTQTAMRIAIRNVRNALTDFTAEHLPEDVHLRDGLTIQSRLLDAIENMAAKAASGTQKEVGTNILERGSSFVKQHPVVSAVAGAAGYNEAKKLPIIGDFLP